MMNTDIDTPTPDQRAAVPFMQPVGNGAMPFVTLPVCTKLALLDFSPLQSRLLTIVPQHKACGAECAVVSQDIHSPRSTRKKLYLIRQTQLGDPIRFGELYLIETENLRIFRVVYRERGAMLRLKRVGDRMPSELLDLKQVRSLWLVCAVLDYMEPSDEEPEE